MKYGTNILILVNIVNFCKVKNKRSQFGSGNIYIKKDIFVTLKWDHINELYIIDKKRKIKDV